MMGRWGEGKPWGVLLWVAAGTLWAALAGADPALPPVPIDPQAVLAQDLPAVETPAAAPRLSQAPAAAPMEPAQSGQTPAAADGSGPAEKTRVVKVRAQAAKDRVGIL
ncbi:MAG: hypothetical protein ACE5ER_04180, partial [Nitrospinaceae bacterium]